MEPIILLGLHIFIQKAVDNCCSPPCVNVTTYPTHLAWGDNILCPSGLRFDAADWINSCCYVQISCQCLPGCCTDWGGSYFLQKLQFIFRIYGMLFDVIIDNLIFILKNRNLKGGGGRLDGEKIIDQSTILTCHVQPLLQYNHTLLQQIKQKKPQQGSWSHIMTLPLHYFISTM